MTGKVYEYTLKNGVVKCSYVRYKASHQMASKNGGGGIRSQSAGKNHNLMSHFPLSPKTRPIIPVTREAEEAGGCNFEASFSNLVQGPKQLMTK